MTRVQVSGWPTVRAFEVDRADRGPLLVLWDQRDTFGGEDEPPVSVSWPWPGASATVTNVFGQAEAVHTAGGELRLPVSDTPVFVA